VTLRRFEKKARQCWWLINLEASRQSGLSLANYCSLHGLTATTFGRWRIYLVGKEAVRKHADYQAELRPQQRREAQEKRRKRPPLSFRRQHGHVQSRGPDVLGDARRGDELKRDERAGVRGSLASVADLSAQMARTAGRRRGGRRLAGAPSSLGPSGRWH
jgi:hypothetical protein